MQMSKWCSNWKAGVLLLPYGDIALFQPPFPRIIQGEIYKMQ